MVVTALQCEGIWLVEGTFPGLTKRYFIFLSTLLIFTHMILLDIQRGLL